MKLKIIAIRTLKLFASGINALIANKFGQIYFHLFVVQHAL